MCDEVYQVKPRVWKECLKRMHVCLLEQKLSLCNFSTNMYDCCSSRLESTASAMQDSDRTLAMKWKERIAPAISVQQARQLPGISVILGLSPSTERPKQCLRAAATPFSLKLSGWMHQSQLVTSCWLLPHNWSGLQMTCTCMLIHSLDV